MGERQRVRAEDMATTSTAVATVSPQPQEECVERVAVITLRPAAAAGGSGGTDRPPRKKVVWTEDTVDNEHMDKKKSKCCCIYEKPRRFGESESESSDDECEHCFGHVERRHQQHAPPLAINEPREANSEPQETVSREPTATISLEPRGAAPTPAPAPEAPPS